MTGDRRLVTAKGVNAGKLKRWHAGTRERKREKAWNHVARSSNVLRYEAAGVMLTI
jgi:hypothetical protein